MRHAFEIIQDTSYKSYNMYLGRVLQIEQVFIFGMIQFITDHHQQPEQRSPILKYSARRTICTTATAAATTSKLPSPLSSPPISATPRTSTSSIKQQRNNSRRCVWDFPVCFVGVF